MRSIRWSLLAYFLVLVAVALGAVAVSSYENTKEILKEREVSRRKLLENQLEADEAAESQRLDAKLLAQAHRLPDQVLFQYEWGTMRYALPLAPMCLLNSGVDPNGLLVLPIWYEEGRRGEERHGPAYKDLFKVFVSNILIPGDVPRRPSDELEKLYFQCTSESGFTRRSQSLGNLSFPFDLGQFATTPLHEPKYEDTQLSGRKVRLVMLKEAVTHQQFKPGPRLQRPEPSRPPRPEANRPQRPDTSRPEKPRPEPLPRTSPAILIWCAGDTKERDEAIAGLHDRLNDQFEKVRIESQENLAEARDRLLVIALATFFATMAGGFWIVRLGLVPLHRLSEAVSKVSPKDFRLPLDDAPLPQELRPIAERLTQTLDLLKRAFAREKQAAADISHELRTPLAALLTTIEVGLRKPRSSDEYREMLADCHASGQQMSQLVERLLALARLDAGADTLRPREVDVAALADQCATLVRPLAEARGLSLRVQRNGPIPLRTDADKLREVVTNLLHNAIEYNRPHGSIELAVEQQNGELVLEVRDSGIGIAPELREHIFERFYRVDSSRQADGLHAGLGLAIVKGYVDLMGGQITVESTEGQGSAFCVRFPVQKMTNGPRGSPGGQPKESQVC